MSLPLDVLKLLQSASDVSVVVDNAVSPAYSATFAARSQHAPKRACVRPRKSTLTSCRWSSCAPRTETNVAPPQFVAKESIPAPLPLRMPSRRTSPMKMSQHKCVLDAPHKSLIGPSMSISQRYTLAMRPNDMGPRLPRRGDFRSGRSVADGAGKLDTVSLLTEALQIADICAE